MADRGRIWPLCLGGFLGPYASTMVTPMMHEVGAGLGSPPERIAWAVTVYMLPFAGLMLVSGTLAERWGRTATVRVALAAFLAASAVCAAAPSVEVFLLGRFLQGATNAFTTPVLIAMLTDAVPRARLGRALGWFGALQAAGQGVGPVLSGLAATLDWRLAFTISAALAVVVLVVTPADAGSTDRPPATWRALRSARLALAGAQSFVYFFGATGLTVLGVLVAADRFGLGPATRGLLGLAFGLAGLVAARPAGGVLDSHDPLRVGVVMNLLFAAGLGLAAVAGNAGLLVAGVTVVGASATGLRAVLNSLAATATDTNRGGAVSVVLAAQFFGGALAPLVWLPGYDALGGDVLFALIAVPAFGVALLAFSRPAMRAGTRHTDLPDQRPMTATKDSSHG